MWNLTKTSESVRDSFMCAKIFVCISVFFWLVSCMFPSLMRILEPFLDLDEPQKEEESKEEESKQESDSEDNDEIQSSASEDEPTQPKKPLTKVEKEQALMRKENELL